MNPIANGFELNRRKFFLCLYWELGPSDQNVKFYTCGNSERMYLRTGDRCAEIPTGPWSRFADTVQKHKGLCDLMYRTTVCRLAWAWLTPKWTACISLWYLQLKFSEKNLRAPHTHHLWSCSCFLWMRQTACALWTSTSWKISLLKKHCCCFLFCYLFITFAVTLSCFSWSFCV